MTPSLTQPTRIALEYDRRRQRETETLSQGLFSLRDALFARTMMQSSPLLRTTVPVTNVPPATTTRPPPPAAHSSIAF